MDEEWFAPVNACDAGTCDGCANPWAQRPVDMHLDGSRKLSPAEIAEARDKLRQVWGSRSTLPDERMP